MLIISRQYKEATEVSLQGINIDDKNVKLYDNLGYALSHNPTLVYNSDTNPIEKAIEAYKKVIALTNGDERWQIYANQAKLGISDLEKLLEAKTEVKDFEKKYYTKEMEVRGQ